MSDKRLEEYTARDFVELIDSKFEENAGEIRRVDPIWGTWSREMNLEIRKRIESEGNGKMIMGMVFSYWLMISQLLDMVYECSGWKAIFMEKKLKNRTDEALTLRRRILEFE